MSAEHKECLQPPQNHAKSWPNHAKSRQHRWVTGARSAPVAAAARQSGNGERAIHRWLHDDKQFQTKLHPLRQEALAQALSCLRQAASDAVAAMY